MAPPNKKPVGWVMSTKRLLAMVVDVLILLKRFLWYSSSSFLFCYENDYDRVQQLTAKLYSSAPTATFFLVHRPKITFKYQVRKTKKMTDSNDNYFNSQ